MRFIKEPLLYKPIDTWTNKDFVCYFSRKAYDKTGYGLSIPNDGWVLFVGRVKNFRGLINISAAEYKEFIDKVTDILFTRKGAVPAFDAIVSNKVYNLFTNANNTVQCNNDDFIKLRDTLLKDDSLVFSIENAHANYTD